MAKRLGIIPHLFAQPLFHGMRKRNDPNFELIEDSPAQLAIKLRENKLDGAFLSPIDYAKDYAMYRIVPEVSIVSEAESNTVLLFFKEDIKKVETVAIDPRFSSEIVLASIILTEKFNTKPKLIPFEDDSHTAFHKADTILIVGDENSKWKENRNKLDLVDEWHDLVELPYVHGVWTSRENTLTKEEIGFLITTGGEAESLQDTIGVSGNKPNGFYYKLDEPANAALIEFFRMAYYHGILKDIPDIKYFQV